MNGWPYFYCLGRSGLVGGGRLCEAGDGCWSEGGGGRGRGGVEKDRHGSAHGRASQG